jgi:O-antigen/teichoic acid export membrane protein
VLRTIVGGASWGVASQMIIAGGSLLLTPFLVNHFGLTSYGLLSLVLIVNAFLTSFDGGLQPTASRYFSVFAGSNDERSTTRLACTMLGLIAVLGGVFALIVFLLAPEAIKLFNIPTDLVAAGVFLFRIVGALVVAGFFHTVFLSLLQARHRYALVNMANLASYLVWAIGLVVSLSMGYGLRVVGLLLVLQQCAASLLVVPAAARYIKRRYLGIYSLTELRALAAFSVRAQASNLASLINNQVDAFVIGALLPIRYVGLYNVGANMAFQLRGLIGNALTPAANHLGRTFGQSGEEVALVEMSRLQRLWVKACTAWFSSVAAVSYFAIVAWLGHRFALGGLTALILLVGYMVNMYTGMLILFLNAIGKPGIETNYGLVSVLVNIVLTAALAVFGIIGIVTATAVGTAAGSLYLVWLTRRRVRADVPNFLIEVPVIAGVVAAGVSGGLAFAVEGHVPRGPIGLVAVGVCAIPGLLAFGLIDPGPRSLWRAVDSLRGWVK